MGRSEQHTCTLYGSHVARLHSSLITPSKAFFFFSFYLVKLLIKKRLAERRHKIHCILLNIHEEFCSPAWKSLTLFLYLRVKDIERITVHLVFLEETAIKKQQRKNNRRLKCERDTDSNPQITIAAFIHFSVHT